MLPSTTEKSLLAIAYASFAELISTFFCLPNIVVFSRVGNISGPGYNVVSGYNKLSSCSGVDISGINDANIFTIPCRSALKIHLPAFAIICSASAWVTTGNGL